MGNPSEIARLRALIDLEVEALQQLRSGFAVVASHEVITRHYRVLDACYEGLVEHLGEEEAIDAICERINTLQ